MTEPACVYTVLLGSYEDLLEQPMAAASGIDFICLTDDSTLQSTSWQTRQVDRVIPADPTRSSRYPKICPHDFLDDYAVSVYIDNSVLLRQTPEILIEALLPTDAGLAAIKHSFRDSIRDEFQAVAAAGYDAEWILNEQLEHYEQSWADVLSLPPLIGGVLIRRHMLPAVTNAMDLWWFNVLRYSRRDQLSFRIALEQASLVPTVWSPDIRDNEFWQWPASTGKVRRRGGALPAGPEPATVKPQLQDETVAALTKDSDAMRKELEPIRASHFWRTTRGMRTVGSWTRRLNRSR